MVSKSAYLKNSGSGGDQPERVERMLLVVNAIASGLRTTG